MEIGVLTVIDFDKSRRTLASSRLLRVETAERHMGRRLKIRDFGLSSSWGDGD